MTLLTKVGSFVANTATGAQAVTGVGFKPKAIIFWYAGSAASGTWESHVMTGLGFTAGASNSYSCSAGAVDATGTSDTARRMAAKAITVVRWDSVVSEADLTSFDTDGFTLNWTAQAWAVARNICFLAIGGTDITGAQVVNWTTPTGPGLKAVTGVGFKPDLVLHAHALTTALPASSVHAMLGFGAMNRHGQQGTNAFVAIDAVNPSNTSRYQQTDAAFVAVDATEAVDHQAHFVSMDSDGFTLTFSNTIGTAFNAISLCLKGISSKIGSSVKPITAAPVAQSITRLGFTPKAVIATGIATGSAAAPSANAWYSFGAADAASSRAVAISDGDAVTPTVSKVAWDNSGIIIASNGSSGSPATLYKAAMTSLDTDGFSLNWTPNETTPVEHLYIAIGPVGKNTYPATVGI